jgi:hypothetical protein
MGGTLLSFRQSPVITMSITQLSETKSREGIVQAFAVREMRVEEDMSGLWAAYYVPQPERT